MYHQQDNPDLKPSSDVYFDQVSDAMTDSSRKWAKLVEWVSVAFGDMLDGVPSENPNPYVKIWSRLKYGATEGTYDTARTDRGINALVSASAHFALYQFDPTNLQTCTFFSNTGAGRIILNQRYYFVLIASGISLAVVVLLQLIWWYLSHLNDYRVDLASRVLTDKLRMIYAVRDNVGKLAFPNQGFTNMSDLAFEKKHQDVLVRYGELKSSREKETGELVVALTQDVVGIRNGRKYS